MSAERRLAELGLTLPEVPAPLAAYVPAVRSGNHVYSSGQLPLVNGKLLATGKVSTASTSGAVGAVVTPEQAYDCARQCALNALAAVRTETGDLEVITRVVKTVVYVASAPDFTGQPQVANGASELFGAVFGDPGQHARSAVGVAALPLDAPVELELIVEVG